MPSKNSIRTNYKDKLSKLFASLAIVAFGTLAVLNSFIMSGSNAGIDAVVFALKVAIPPAVVLGVLGYFMGTVLDKRPGKRRQIKFTTAARQADSPASQIESVFVQDASLEPALQIGDGDE